MNSKEIYLGDSKVNFQEKEVGGEFVVFQNEKFYKISNYKKMPDFFMTIVSNSDHWMFLSSTGSLTAGRKNRDNALFPYYQVDKIHDYKGITGSRTCLLVEKETRRFLWEPFTDESGHVYKVQRNLYKSIYGNKIVFEEINTDLEISFSYGWYNSEKYGWIKKSFLKNLGKSPTRVEVLDGLSNLLPYGVDYAFQTEYSNLLDAYKKCELIPESKLGLFVLSSIPVDKPEPSEALKATTVWSNGLGSTTKYLLSDRQFETFKKGIKVETEVDVRAARGAYYISDSINLKTDETQEWFFAAELNQDSADVANLDHFLRTTKKVEDLVSEDIDSGTSSLIKVVSSADGLQKGRDELAYARHFSNTLYNIMRGGVFADNYTAEISDFLLYVQQSNRKVQKRFSQQLEKLPEFLSCTKLISWAREQKNPELERIALEYLPLTFSRRHGDPSRPWNQFSIDIKNSDGTDKLNYQGNWRDIFQNWEALSLSYPEFIEGMLGKFLNASTVDGYNPYRITRDGIDWECADPDDPWSFIGYWGDHQIIYLQKFLEQSEAFFPGKLEELLSREIFVFANVPYRIKSFEDIVKNPKDTINFDHDLNADIVKLTEEIGADGRLLRNSDNKICRANLTEKILVTMLAKLSNFIPEAGIWLNTQRPEWNDANNALVGNGVSMVTLYYLRRFLEFWEARFTNNSLEEIKISEEIKTHLDQTFSIFTENIEVLQRGFSDKERYSFTRSLGQAGSQYRTAVYMDSFSGRRSGVKTEKLKEFVGLALKYMNHSIGKNRREDGLYHAYNLVSFKGESISIRNLYEMLEGQVSVLSSGYLSTKESLDVLDALKDSRMFRQDQYSYMLYPNRQLPRFEEKNNIPEKSMASSALLQKLVTDMDTSLVNRDVRGGAHFNGAFRKAADLEFALDKLNTRKYASLVQTEKEDILGIFEDIFDHQSFTGRSGTFYGYEGLGSIYWHMVSKLLLAAQECYFRGEEKKADPLILGRIKDHYYEIKAGIGLYKSPDIYGAFPTDAYSHTPANAGAKQPGLTGQVKEDVISRLYELGLHIKGGKISFDPSLLNREEVLLQKSTFNYFDHSGKEKSLTLEAKQLGFTFCQFPVIYTFAKADCVIISYVNGDRKEFPGNIIPEEISQQIFSRSAKILSIEFHTEH
jgi:hypothetical protein